MRHWAAGSVMEAALLLCLVPYVVSEQLGSVRALRSFGPPHAPCRINVQPKSTSPTCSTSRLSASDAVWASTSETNSPADETSGQLAPCISGEQIPRPTWPGCTCLLRNCLKLYATAMMA